jgi:apolipoprotein D and lipocalin family protein
MMPVPVAGPTQGKGMRRVALCVLSLCLLASSPSVFATEVESVPDLDIGRYAGEWHEIARLPMFFQRKCVSDITAQYTLNEDGQIGVVNRCRNDDGELEQAEGVARRVEGHPGRLQVRFAPDWLSWMPFTWADYWVIALDSEYQWAVIGEPGRDYLWILSRTPELGRTQFDQIKARVVDMGYELDELIISAPIR